jgi:hypothetical protein
MTDKIKAVLEELYKKAVENYFFPKRSLNDTISHALIQLDALYKAKYLGMLPEEKELTNRKEQRKC